MKKNYRIHFNEYDEDKNFFGIKRFYNNLTVDWDSNYFQIMLLDSEP
jgi:hypothetical protein